MVILILKMIACELIYFELAFHFDVIKHAGYLGTLLRPCAVL